MRKFMVSKKMDSTRALVLARAAGVALALAALQQGCGRDDQVGATIRSTSIELAAMSPGASASTARTLDEKAYTKIISELKAVSGKGGEGQQAAVDLLTARAQIGLATQASTEAAALEQGALNAATAIRAPLQEYYAYSAQADALSQYDPAPLLADLDRQITEREAELAKARTARQEVDARIAALRAQAQAKMDQAAAEHKIEAELREQSVRVSNTEAAELIAQANQHRRVADAFDVEASMFDAQAAQIAPLSPEAQLMIDQLTNQRNQLGRAREEVLQSDTDNRRLATEARANQAQAASAVDAAVKAMIAAREGGLAAAYEDAARKFGEAATSATRAAKASRTQANLAAGEARQALGDLHWRRAQGLESAAAILSTLAEVSPALPDASSYTAQAAEARKAQAEALGVTTEAYQGAREAFEASNAAGRVEEVTKGLADIILKTSGGAIDLSAQESALNESDSESTEDEPAADTSAIDPDSPNATLAALVEHMEASEFDRVPAYLHTPEPQMKALAEAAVSVVGKFTALESAVEAKFGTTLVESSPLGAMGASVPGVSDLGSFDASAVRFTITGDTAVGTMPDDPGEIPMRRVDGRWLVDFSLERMGPDLQIEQVQMFGMMLPGIGQAIDSLRADVEAGKFATIEELHAAIDEQVQSMMGGMGGMGGPGGG